jgi:hypothetical protein
MNGGTFVIRDSVAIEIATGKRVATIEELRGRLGEVGADSIYWHFWGALLRPRFAVRRYGNDFAEWADRRLLDRVAAERLGAVDPSDFQDSQALRGDLVRILDERCAEAPERSSRRADRAFDFVRAQLAVFDTGIVAQRPGDLARLLPVLPLGSAFYHLVDARRRNPDGADDFSAWLASQDEDYGALTAELSRLRPHLVTLSELQSKAGAALARHFPEDAP